MDKKGKLIVIDGADGVGKATQTKLLVARLRSVGVPVATLDFPQYEANFFGKFIGECLTGTHGDFLAVDPHIASVLYAADRFESREKIMRWLRAGKTVVLDRYVSANQMHQGAKIHNAKKQREFLAWLDTMEHGVFGLPRPDLIVFLNLPTAISLRLLKDKEALSKKTYRSGGQADQAESNPKHLAAARANALKLVAAHNHWVKVDCAKGTAILPKEAIHELVYTRVRKLLKIEL